MKDTIFITLDQYQKHLITDLLKDNGVEVQYDETVAPDAFNLTVRIKTDSEGKEIIPYEKIYTLIVKDMKDMHLALPLEVFSDLSILINEPTRYLDPLYYAFVSHPFSISRSEIDILLNKNNEMLLALPYTWVKLN